MHQFYCIAPNNDISLIAIYKKPEIDYLHYSVAIAFLTIIIWRPLKL